jgi:hypothetical protein
LYDVKARDIEFRLIEGTQVLKEIKNEVRLAFENDEA